ncbi:hypothetical protein LS68_003330 [Helicobacter sp. MIT 05-5293]|uniref:hypothetical protein n=1 Tax=Helicobacter sp. MIT 05-5293 TaxID=1548149 RepID=UPI0010FD8CD3|nr:hypothetical protein [Helicobacter sp. MIT 05-5293]TLD82047.1 hypothetical protein LS68_003330 [Helicobacter sp. MIT 05-5293]
MEIEFEWYIAHWYPYQGISQTNFSKTITFPHYDKYLQPSEDTGGMIFIALCLGIIKSYQILPTNTALNIIEEEPLGYDLATDRLITYKDLFTPLPTAALATTMTNINDFIVNLRDKPDTKEGKIIAQLFSQEFSYALLEPKFQKLQEENGWGDETPFSFVYEELSTYYLAQKSYYEKEKQNLILVWNIESNNWAKVWVLKMPDKKSVGTNEKTFEELMEYYDIRDSVREIISTYSQTFLESPSQLKLYEGYIHCSGLQYLLPFTQNYIKR